jgi:hypothetical protein
MDCVGERNAGLRKADCWDCDNYAGRSGGLCRSMLGLTSVSTITDVNLGCSDRNTKQYEVGRIEGKVVVIYI